MTDRKKPAVPARRPGAQPGNSNAFKHGYYAKNYFPLELKDLDTALGEGLQDEISLLRVIIRRVFEFANDDQNQDLETWSRSLNTLGAAATRLAGLLRTNQIIGGAPTDTLEILANSLGKVAHELGWPDPSAN